MVDGHPRVSDERLLSWETWLHSTGSDIQIVELVHGSHPEGSWVASRVGGCQAEEPQVGVHNSREGLIASAL